MKRFMVIARCYPDLDPDYDGPELSLEEQVQGVTREWPIMYGTRAEAQTAINRLTAHPDPSFCNADDQLTIQEIHW